MQEIEIPKSYNYISAFLTFDCTLNCSYCINKYNGLYKYTIMGAEDWIKGLNRLRTRDIPITFSGGEPTLHPKFFDILNEVRKPMDLLTNGEFSVTIFMKRFSPDKFKRDAPYASIRFSYHPEQMKFMELLGSVIRLQEEGYSVGVWAVGNTIKNRLVQLLARFMGVDFRIKELLDNKHGHYKYPKGLDGIPKDCFCKPSELLIAPDGRMFKCHHDLYHGVNSYGHLLDNNVKLPEQHSPCHNYGMCSPCDLKIKFSRHQVWGHCSVEIWEIRG